MSSLRASLSLLSLALATSACSEVEIEKCVERQWVATKGNRGFELIDLGSRQVWATRDWEVADFEAFNLPLSWSLWRKNDPRTRAATSGRILRSPGCEAGQYTYMKALGREFMHVVNLDNFGEVSDASQGLIRAVQLNKHHELSFEQGGPIQVLTAPDGQRFVLIARTLSPAADTPTVPDGWTLERGTLAEPFRVLLDGPVTVLRTDNEDSFQGPLPEKIAIPLAN